MEILSRWTVAILPEGETVPRKVTKIVALTDGGFSLVMPYHKERSGYLCKMPVDPSQPRRHEIPWDQTMGFTVESRAKFSYHSDGFAQFSSEQQGDLISGRDPDTGAPKGLGLMTHPLASPICSGPSVALQVWGINEFAPLDDPTDAMIFEPDEFYYRGCTPSDASGWVVSIYVFPAGVVPPCRRAGRDFVLDIAFEGINGPLTSVVRMKVARLPKNQVFLGVMANRAIVSVPSVAGWILSGPGDYTAQQKGHVLVGFYPREAIPVDSRPPLDRPLR